MFAATHLVALRPTLVEQSSSASLTSELADSLCVDYLAQVTTLWSVWLLLPRLLSKRQANNRRLFASKKTDFVRFPSFLYRIAALAAIYRVLTENISSMIFAKIIHIDKKKVGHIINVFPLMTCPIFLSLFNLFSCAYLADISFCMPKERFQNVF